MCEHVPIAADPDGTVRQIGSRKGEKTSMDRRIGRAKKFLSSYRFCLEEERALRARQDRLYENRQDELVREYGIELEKLRDIRHAVRMAIEGLCSGEDRMILSYRYIDFMNPEEIAEVMGLDINDIIRKHDAALVRLEYEEIMYEKVYKSRRPHRVD